MFGSHKPEKCWKLHPELKPKNMASGEERDKVRYRDRSRERSRSKEKGREGSKRGREKSPYPRNPVRRVTSGDREDTDRDSDDSQDTADQLKEAEKKLKSIRI